MENIACREREAGGEKKAHTEICWRDPSNAERYNRSVTVTEEKEGSGKRCTPVITLYFWRIHTCCRSRTIVQQIKNRQREITKFA